MQNHRSELWKLGFTEMWERFGFYIWIDIMVYLLTEVFRFSETASSSLYGKWTAAVYLAPLLGGYIADRYLGYRRAVLSGVLTLAAGYLLLAVAFYLRALPLVYGALAILVAGNGLFKPNMSAMIGNLYPAGDPRTDSAFSIFYQFVNGGALLSPLVAASVRHHFSTPAALVAAGAGLLLAVAGTIINWKHYAALDRASSLAAVTGVPLPPQFDDPPEDPAVERERIRAIVIVCLIVVAFWVAFHQNGSTLAFWAEKNTDLTLGGFLVSHPTLNRAMELVGWASKGQLDPVLFQAVNSLCIIFFTAPMLGLFAALERRGWAVPTPAKIGLGMALTAVTYGVMALAGYMGGDTGRVAAAWLVGGYALISAAELCLSPMGLSLVTKLAPRRYVGLMLGVWYLTIALGSYLCGFVGRFWALWPHHTFFLFLVGISLAPMGLLALQYRRLLAVMPSAPAARPAPVPAPPALGLTLETEAC